MKLRYVNLSLNLNQLVFILTVSLVFISCEIYQNTPDNDGIYGDETRTRKEEGITTKENYFLKELNSLEKTGNNDTFADVNNYNSADTFYTDKEALNYTRNQIQSPNNDLVISLNLNSNPYWNNNVGYGYYNTWGNGNWGNNGYFWNYNPYWYPNYNTWGIGYYNTHYYQPYYGYASPYRGYNNRYYRNKNYRRRTTNRGAYRKNGATSVRRSTSTSTNRRPTTTSRRRSSTTTATPRSSATTTTRRSNSASYKSPARSSSTRSSSTRSAPSRSSSRSSSKKSSTSSRRKRK